MKYTVKNSTSNDIFYRIFENRRIDLKDVDDFLKPQKNCVTTPLIYRNMEEGFDLLKHHIENKSLILFVVDADTDGFCSSATFINYLRFSLKYTNVAYVFHEKKKHGLTKQIMSEIQRVQPDLVIVADAGSGDYKQHKELKEDGIDLLIIDHHECEEYSSDAIVINNQLSNGNYTLCGAGMVLKFLEYIDMRLLINQSEYYQDLVALALVADGMDMTELETRYYVLNGLRNINNPFLKQVVKEVDNPYEFIAYGIAPVVNAIIRMGEMKDKKDLFECMLYHNRKETINIRGKGIVEMPLAEYVVKLSERMKSRQTRQIDKILNSEDTIVINENYPFTILIHTDGTAQSLSGLIAGKVAEKYNKPTLVLREKIKDGMLVYGGSARSIRTFPNFKDYLVGSNKFQKCEGHQSAFGVNISADKLQEFLDEYMFRQLPISATNHIVDKAYRGDRGERVSAYEIAVVDGLKQHWSKGFEQAKFFIRLQDINSTDIKTMGADGRTIKIQDNGISFIKFKCTEEEVNTLTREGFKTIDIIGTFNINRWNNRNYPQVKIEEFEVTSHMDFDDVNSPFGYSPVEDDTKPFGYNPFKL